MQKPDFFRIVGTEAPGEPFKCNYCNCVVREKPYGLGFLCRVTDLEPTCVNWVVDDNDAVLGRPAAISRRRS